MIKNEREMLWRKDETTPSLRRHYPDQVYGYDLRLSLSLSKGYAQGPNTPGTLKTYLATPSGLIRFQN